jgi:lipoprotein-releasing system permease protein
VAGGFRTGRYENDTKELYIERDRFRKWTNAQSEVSEVYVTVEAGADLDAVRDGLEVAYRAADMLCQVETWEDRHHVFLGAVENERTILGTVLFFFVLLTCTITFSMVSMMVQEKIRDIGILAAMGASPGGIGFLFGLCAVFVAAMGSLFGLATGTLVVLNVNAVEDFIAAVIGQPIFRKDVYAFTEIPAKLDTPLNLQIVGATIVFAVIICGWPALRAGRMDPVEALRHE